MAFSDTLTLFDQVRANLHARGALTIDEFLSVSKNWSNKQTEPAADLLTFQTEAESSRKTTPPPETSESDSTIPPSEIGRNNEEDFSQQSLSMEKAEMGLEDGTVSLLYPESDLIVEEALAKEPEVQHEEEPDPSSRAIRDACLKNNAAGATMRWQVYTMKDRTTHDDTDRTYGAALEILIPGRDWPLETFSTDAIYKDSREAQAACSDTALKAGILRKIAATKPVDFSAQVRSRGTILYKPVVAAEEPLSVQAFNDQLPKPDLGLKDGLFGKIPPSAYLYKTIGSAKGSGMGMKDFYWRREENGGVFHGCLLRLEREDEVLSYLADARFASHQHAKSAASLIALSRGLKTRLKQVQAEAANKVDEDQKNFCVRRFYPFLSQLLKKYPQASIEYSYNCNKNVWGATLVLYYRRPQASPIEHRWTVGTEHVSKANAKVAVAYHAAKEGLVECIQFAEGPPPEGYVTWWKTEQQQNLKGNLGKKRNHAEVEPGEVHSNSQPKKKSKGSKEAGAVSGKVHLGAPLTGANQVVISTAPRTYRSQFFPPY